MSVPATVRAITVKEPGKAVIETVPTPKLRDDYILVKTRAVALNPTDTYSVKAGHAPGTILGCDYVGEVVKVGSKVTKDLKPGDRIAGWTPGANKVQPEDGAFAEYIVVKDGIQIKVPDNMTDEEAATLGVGVSTVAQGLFQYMGLPLPDDPAAVAATAGSPILIYGGSTATGMFGIQFAKLAGFRVLATASPHNHAHLKSIGADAVFDHTSATWMDEVRDATGGKLRYAWDCISKPATTEQIARALDRDEPGAKLGVILPVEKEVVQKVNDKVDGPNFILAYTIFGEDFERLWGPQAAKPEDYEYGKRFWKMSEGLFAQGKLRGLKQDVDRHGKGLDGVLKGLDDLANGKVSGVKLVYHL